jgi:hypothetical protein
MANDAASYACGLADRTTLAKLLLDGGCGVIRSNQSGMDLLILRLCVLRCLDVCVGITADLQESDVLANGEVRPLGEGGEGERTSSH